MLFGEVNLCQKVPYLRQNDLFHKEIQNCGHSSALEDSYEVYISEIEKLDRKENIDPSFFDPVAQNEPNCRGVVALNKETPSSMISFGDHLPNGEASFCLKDASFVEEDGREKDMELDYLASFETEDSCDSMVSLPANDMTFGANEVFSAAGDGCEVVTNQNYFTSIGDQFKHLENEKFSSSSLTLAANRSLDMSRSLTDRCFQMANLAVTSDNFSIDKLNSQKRQRPFSADMTEFPLAKLKEAFDEEKESHVDPLAISTFSSSTSSPFREDQTFAHVSKEQMTPKSSQRYHVIQEIVDTEQKYCACLLLLQNHFAEKLSLSGFLKESDICVIFPPCLRQILAFHSDFYQKLKSRYANWTKLSTIADLIILLVESTACELLKHYQTYVSLFPNSILHLRSLCQLNSKIEGFVKELERDSRCQGLDISAYLLTPIQRIPRYVLLLKQLVKCTSEDHPDFRMMDSCLIKLGEFLNTLNDSIQSSIELVSNVALPKSKRRFNFNTMSFRYHSTSHADAAHLTYFKHQKNSDNLKMNRISLDLSFLGAFKKKEPIVVDQKAQSEICLHKPVDSCSPPSIHMTSTPQNSSFCQSFRTQKKILQLPSPLRKSKRKFEEPHNPPTADAMDTSSNMKKKMSKKTRSFDRTKDLDSSSKSVSPNACVVYVGDGSTPDRKSKLGTLTERFNWSSKNKGELRRKTSVRDAIRNFFVRKSASKRSNDSHHSTTSDEKNISNC